MEKRMSEGCRLSSGSRRWQPESQNATGKFGNTLLKWKDSLPKRVLLIKKPDPSLLEAFVELVTHLVMDLCQEVYVEQKLYEQYAGKPCSIVKQRQLDAAARIKTFRYGEAKFTDKVIDLIVCLGGDGTLLYASSLFKQDVPPILGFHLGSLGFLTPHKFENFKHDIKSVLDSRSFFSMRTRLTCSLRKATDCKETKEQRNDGQLVMKTQVLNEVVIDRGHSGCLCVLDVIIEQQSVTTVQGDGLVVSSPTGSTAYAMAAGASMVHPSVPGLVVAPICPHSLSFRPVVLPADVCLEIRLAESTRDGACVSFDGRDRQRLMPGDVVAVTTSRYSVPSVSARSPLQDWFSGLADCFHWNVRTLQKKSNRPG